MKLIKISCPPIPLIFRTLHSLSLCVDCIMSVDIPYELRTNDEMKMFKIVRDGGEVPGLMSCCGFRRCRLGRHCWHLPSRWCCGLWSLWEGVLARVREVLGILEEVRRTRKYAEVGAVDLLMDQAWDRFSLAAGLLTSWDMHHRPLPSSKQSGRHLGPWQSHPSVGMSGSLLVNSPLGFSYQHPDIDWT